jgi:hypothetical protein
VSVVVLDTDVASALLRRRAPDALGRQLAGHILARDRSSACSAHESCGYCRQA